MSEPGTTVGSAFAAAAGRAAAAAAELKRRWREGGEPPDAAGALRDHPDLLRFKSVVIDLAYEEYCLREERGTAPDADRFCDALPAFRSGVKSVIQAHRVLADHPELLPPAADPEEWPAPGARVEGLKVVTELGRGGFARAYLAFDPPAARLCVLKLSRTRGGEGQALGPLNHPHITGMYWARPVGTGMAVCLPLLGITTLDDARSAAFADGPPRSAADLLAPLEPGRDVVPPPPDRPAAVRPGESYAAAVAAVAARVADALAYLHARGFAHGDLKPSNVVLGPDAHPYLIDFNLAGPSDAGRVGGTPAYMAPEVLGAFLGRPGPPADRPPADVYSFGVMVYEALTGRLPWSPGSDPDAACAAAELLAARAARPGLAWPTGLRPPRPVARLIERCLAERPADRPSAADVTAGLDAWLEHVRGRRRRLGRRALLAAALSAVVAVGVGVWKSTPRTADEFFARGLGRLKHDDFTAALEDFETAQRLSPDPRYLAYSGYCLLRRGDKAADVRNRQAHDADPADPAVRNNLAASLIRNGRHGQAVDHLNVVVEQRPEWIEPRYNRAEARFLDKDVPANRANNLLLSAQDIDVVLASKPQSIEAYFLAARIFAASSPTDHSLRDRAVDALRQAVQLGDNPRRYRGDGEIMAVLGGDDRFQQILKQTHPNPPPKKAHIRAIEPGRP